MESTEKVSFLISDTWFDFVFLPGRSIWVGITPLTNLQCNIILQYAPESINLVTLPPELNNPKQPRTMISWREGAQLCNALSKLVGFCPAYDAITFEQIPHSDGFHLPVWEDWLLSCFASDQPEEQAKYPWGADPDRSVEYAITSDDSLQYPGLVATRMPNRIGLYDLLGLVHEWGVDIDEQEDDDGKPFRQSFGGSFEDRLLDPSEGEVGVWAEQTRQPTIGLRLYIHDSPEFRGLHQATIEPSISSSLITESTVQPTFSVAASDNQARAEETVAVSPQSSDLTQADTVLDEVIHLWLLIEPNLAGERPLIEATLAFTLAPFDLIIANRSAGVSWLERWLKLRSLVQARPQNETFIDLRELKNELTKEFAEFTTLAATRNTNIQPWDGRLANLRSYFSSKEVVGNEVFKDDYFGDAIVLNVELEFLLHSYTAMRSAFDAIMKDAGLIGAAILTGWLTDTKIQPADPDIYLTLEAGCKYPVTTFGDCVAGLKELEGNLNSLTSRASTESRLTPALARQMWVTLPGRLLRTLESATSIRESNDASKQFLDLCQSCMDALKRFLASGNAETTKDEDIAEDELDPIPNDVRLLGILNPLIPEDLFPVHLFRHRANSVSAEESENLERRLAEWGQTLSGRDKELRESFARVSKILEEVKDVKSVRHDVDHVITLLGWFEVLLGGGGKMPPELSFVDELVNWPSELRTAFKENLLTCWHLYQLDDNDIKTQKVLERLVGTLSCKDHLDVIAPKNPTSEFDLAIRHLLAVVRTSEANGTGYMSSISQAWRNLEHIYEHVPNTVPSLNPLEFYISHQSVTTKSKSDDEE